jgi:hypothetical protein
MDGDCSHAPLRKGHTAQAHTPLTSHLPGGSRHVRNPGLQTAPDTPMTLTASPARPAPRRLAATRLATEAGR